MQWAPKQEYVVTVVHGRTPFDPRGFKHTGKWMDDCVFGDSGSCTDAYGKHHSFIVKACGFYDTWRVVIDMLGKDVHITRIENAMVIDRTLVIS
jgi:hypothetical protein